MDMESSLVIFTNQDKPCELLSTKYDNTVNKYTFYKATSSSKHFLCLWCRLQKSKMCWFRLKECSWKFRHSKLYTLSGVYNLYIFTITPFLIKKILDIPVGYPTVYFSHGMGQGWGRETFTNVSLLSDFSLVSHFCSSERQMANQWLR